MSFGIGFFQRDFNPLRPCGRRPWSPDGCGCFGYISIHSARVGGDPRPTRIGLMIDNFNPLRPCGRRRCLVLQIPYQRGFQSTPPVWAETRMANIVWQPQPFQSTPPVWAETPIGSVFTTKTGLISIHSARVGGDLRSCFQRQRHSHISIHSARVGGDRKTRFSPANSRISIHSARVGGDSKRNHFFVS